MVPGTVSRQWFMRPPPPPGSSRDGGGGGGIIRAIYPIITWLEIDRI